MENQEITRERMARLMAIKQGARGIHFKIDRDYVLKKRGNEGLAALEKELIKLNCPINYRTISGFNFYPAGLRAVSLLAIKKTFGWGDGEIRNLCSYAVGASLIVRIYMKFFYSIPKMLEKVPDIWEDYFDSGKLSVGEYSLEKRYLNLKLEGLDLDPVFCVCLGSFLTTVSKLVVGANNEFECLETKCSFKGDNYHNFLISWKKK